MLGTSGCDRPRSRRRSTCRVVAAVAVSVLALASMSGTALAAAGGRPLYEATVDLSPVAKPTSSSFRSQVAPNSIGNVHCTFGLFVNGSNQFYGAVYGCNRGVNITYLQGFADYPGGQSRTAVNTSSGAFVTSLATTAAFTPYGANLTLIGDLDPGAGYQMQNVECSQTGGHTFHCVARGNA